MSLFDFTKNSEKHRVEQDGSGFSIYPLSESLKDIQLFQIVAQKALKERFSEYEVKPHYSSDFPGKNVIDLVFFMKVG